MMVARMIGPSRWAVRRCDATARRTTGQHFTEASSERGWVQNPGLADTASPLI
jgi:hypothetical protein